MEFEEFTIFDIFIKNDYVYLIVSINNNVIHENEIKIKMNGDILIFNSKKIHIKLEEPILILIYNKPTYIFDNNSTTIEYNNIMKYTVIKNIKIVNQYFLTITTLFKDDYKIFPIFYEYYKNQGVQHFYMYYNGVITSDIKEIFNKYDVTLIEWNFKYWLKNCKFMHHAQLGQMHDALYKYGKNNSEYMIFCDLDEYMNIENTTLKNFILDKPQIHTFGFCNIWSNTIDNNIPNIFPNSFFIGNKYNYDDRSKNIYKTIEHDVIGIHTSVNILNSDSLNNLKKSNEFIIDLNMFHFFNWSKSNRREALYNLYETKLYL